MGTISPTHLEDGAVPEGRDPDGGDSARDVSVVVDEVSAANAHVSEGGFIKEASQS